MVAVAPPPPARPPRPIIVTLAAGTTLRRIYNPAFPGFRYYGPLAQRFDHHLGTPGRGRPATGARGIYYAAPSLACCLVEVFGDRGLIEIGDEMLVITQIGRPLRLLDLRRRAAMRAGTVVALAGIRDRRLTQAWSRCFYERTDLYGQVDGLLYPGAHNGADALALYERTEDALTSAAATSIVQRLGDPALDAELRAITRAHGLDMT